ncbi:hypothetical protein BCR34DRAFT_553947 [Clohesyomyces aquaticus]|uniref:CorA-like transporter domain-containing protein n=1 Tax=Clohesyomyces aquaticus TaxID=1231657 RepID=A0A1Y2A9C4_9PLEO|nr:hypothetical protein BCR34DRAFT_553947 [Clohesyomyces aquaticus]
MVRRCGHEDYDTRLVESMKNSRAYPLNLITKETGTYGSTLQSYRRLLDDISENLFIRDCDRDEFEVYTSDLDDTDDMTMHENRSSEELAARVISRASPASVRYVYIHAQTEGGRLMITRKSLEALLSHYQVMPDYLEFMAVFGQRKGAVDLRFSGFRQITQEARSPQEYDPPLEDLMSGFQFCYNLKQAKVTQVNGGCKWSIHNAAIYHQFDPTSGPRWIITTEGSDLDRFFRDRIMVQGDKEDIKFTRLDEKLFSSLSVNLMFCCWATEGWRQYIRWIESELEDHDAGSAHYSDAGEVSKARRRTLFHAADLHDLQYLGERISETITVLEANVEVFNDLRNFCINLLINYEDNCRRSRPSICPDYFDSLARRTNIFRRRLTEMARNAFEPQLKWAKELSPKVRSRMEIIIVQINEQDKLDAKELELDMRRETVGMRIITVITLLYLPATFVSTFFSTDIVKNDSLAAGYTPADIRNPGFCLRDV